MSNSIRQRKKMLHDQHKRAATIAKFGSRRKPAPVTIKRLDGTVVCVVDQREVSG